MHDDMQYDPIQCQDHEPFKVGNPVIIKSYLFSHLQTIVSSNTVHRLTAARTVFSESELLLLFLVFPYFFLFLGRAL